MARRILIFVAILASSGCGYRSGYTARRDIRNVAIPVFGNDSFYRGIEIDLTREVISSIEKKTPYRVVDSSAADAVFEGRIKESRITVLQEDAGNRPTQVQLTLVVAVVLRRPVDGKVLFKGDIKDAESYVPPLGGMESQTWSVLARRSAARIVDCAFDEDW